MRGKKQKTNVTTQVHRGKGTKAQSFFISLLIVGWIVMSFLFFLPANSEALMLKKDLGTLANEADTIITGKVTNMKSQWEDNKIFTYVTIGAKDILKGAKKTEIIIKVPGGTVGDTACFVTDTPNFRINEEVFLFLKAKNNYFNLLGGPQGKYTIMKNQVLSSLGPNLTVNDFKALVFSKMGAKQKTEKGISEPALRIMSQEVFNAPKKESRSVNSPSNNQGFALSGSSDRNNNPSLQSSWVTILQEDFNLNWPSANPKWTREGKPDCKYTWGVDTFKPHSGSYSAWCAGERLGGCPDLNPAASNYPNNMDALMVYGPFDLSDATTARMTFYHWTQTESDFYDYFYFGASSDGDSFYGTKLSGDSGGWRQETLDLKDYCGDSSVWVGFAFKSDNDFTYKGTFVDEVVIEKYVGPPPIITSVVPNFGPAKAKDITTYEAAMDSTQIIIKGSNFVTTPGEVLFWAGQDDGPFTFATIKSWSENQITCLVPGGASSYYTDEETGNVYVITNDKAISNPGLFRVTYSYNGLKWPGNKLIYKVNPNTADCLNEEIAVQEAAHAWNNAGANFNFEYGGTTGKTSVGMDGENSVMWANEGKTDWLAINWIYSNSSNPKIVLENDLEFSDCYDWSTTAFCPSNQLDVQNTATHELGHCLSLLDLYGTADSEKTMYGIGSPGETKARTLETEDIDGIVYIYGPVLPPGATFKGSVKLEKVNPTDPEPDSPSADHNGTEIKIIQPGNPNPVKSGLSSKDGSYLISGLNPGTYEVHYCRPGWSKVERKNISLAANETREMPPLMLFIGDMNQDTYINVQDLLWMAAKIGLRPDQPGWAEAKIADVNKNNYINVQDLLRVAKNIGVHPQ
ncbi:MAG TPA: hypothetical protein DD719_00550 [Desulfotomaculum sp.]|nr:hypothetical protein [Desulfotomaculum sp.]HCJ79721.1 hypothetical protein [Desulfotomaculum sp.]